MNNVSPFSISYRIKILEAYPDFDSLFDNTTIAAVDFTYERLARLLLEFFDKYGYK